jgi:hypothetical protein
LSKPRGFCPAWLILYCYIEARLEIIFGIVIVLVVFLLFMGVRDIRIYHAITLLIIALNVTYCHFLLAANDLKMNLTFFEMKLPYLSSIPIIISIFAIKWSGRLKSTVFDLIIYIVCAHFLLLKIGFGISEFLDPNIEPFKKVVNFVLIINPYIFCILIPLAFTCRKELTIFNGYFNIKNIVDPKIIKIVIKALLIYVLLIIVKQIISGSPLNLFFPTPWLFALRYTLLSIFFYLLADYVIIFLFPRYILDRVSHFKLSSNHRIAIYTILFVLAHIFMGIEEVLWAIFFGAVQAYLYEKTKSLFYGFVLYSATELFIIQKSWLIE